MTTTADRYLALVRALDGLYEGAVMQPEQWRDDELAEWAADTLGSDPLPREVAREVRRGLRMAEKLRSYWSEPSRREAPPAEWRSRVDQAAGSRAWRPGLAIARLGLDAAPSEELFAEVKRRFREVQFERWMEGVDFGQWQAGAGNSRAPS